MLWGRGKHIQVLGREGGGSVGEREAHTILRKGGRRFSGGEGSTYDT